MYTHHHHHGGGGPVVYGSGGPAVYGSGGPRVYGSGGPKVYGSGGPRVYGSGLLPGHTIIPVDEAAHAVHMFKTIHAPPSQMHHLGSGIHGMPHPLHDPLPVHHLMRVVDEHMAHHDERGGFAPLALLAGAAAPFVAPAIHSLLGGVTGTLGKVLTGKIFGNGMVPRLVHLDGKRHYIVHGDGFKDTLRRWMGHLRGIFTSAPARQLGAKGIQAATEALSHVLMEKVGGLGERAKKGIDDRVSNTWLSPVNKMLHNYVDEGQKTANDYITKHVTKRGEDFAKRILDRKSVV